MNILAIEVSTSSAKAVIFSTDRGLLGSENIPYDRSICDVVSQDAEGVYNTAVDCVRKLLAAAHCKIDMVGLSSIWHSLLLLDGNRNPVGRIRTWSNNAAANTISKYQQDKEMKQWIYKRTGCAIHTTYGLWQYMDMRERDSLPLKSDYSISSLPEYIFEKLTGEAGVSCSTASGNGFLNIRTLDWDTEILSFAGLKKGQFSPLRNIDYTAPLQERPAEELGIQAGTPVVITGPDGALNQIGAGALEKGIMTMSIGTSAAIRIAYDKPVLPEKPSTWCYYAGEGIWLAGAATAGAGNCVQWFIKKASCEYFTYQMLEELLWEIDKKNAPVFLPFLYGERCPGWQDLRSGGLFGLKGNHETGHLYYAILEGILFNLYQCYRILVRISEVPKQIRISGGIAHSEFWLQMAADIFRKEVYTSQIEHASTMGAVAVAMKAAGKINTLKEFDPLLDRKVIPNANVERHYRKRFLQYMEWYKKADA